jgi:hypothetical protein
MAPGFPNSVALALRMAAGAYVPSRVMSGLLPTQESSDMATCAASPSSRFVHLPKAHIDKMAWMSGLSRCWQSRFGSRFFVADTSCRWAKLPPTLPSKCGLFLLRNADASRSRLLIKEIQQR